MSTKSRIDRNAKIDTAGLLKSSLSVLSNRASNLDRAKVGDLIDVNLNEIIISPQVRNDIGDIESLAETIKEEGLRNPIEVYYNEDGKLALLAGERRYRSLVSLGAEKARAIIVAPPKDVTDKILRQLSENEERQSLTAMDRGKAYHQLHEEGLSQSEIARRVKRNRMVVRRHLMLYQAPELIKELFTDGLVTDLHAIEMLIKIFEQYPDDFAELHDTAHESGGMNREALENWLKWRESANAATIPAPDIVPPSAAPMGAGENPEESMARTHAPGSETLAPMGASEVQNKNEHLNQGGSTEWDVPMGAGREIHDDEDCRSHETQTTNKFQQEGPGEPTASPAHLLLQAHYTGRPERISPSTLYIEVTARLLDGKTRVAGRLLTNKVDQDSEWVWIKCHTSEEELRVKAKSMKILRVTG